MTVEPIVASAGSEELRLQATARPSPRAFNRSRFFTAMDEAGLEAIVVAAPWNIAYLSGVYIDFYDFFLTTFLVTTRDGAQGMVINESDARFLRSIPGSIDDVRSFASGLPVGTVPGSAAIAIERLIELLDDLGVRSSRLGLDLEYLPVTTMSRLEHALPKAQLLNGSGVLTEARLVKTPDEVALLGYAGTSTAKAIEAALLLAREGDTERSIATAIHHGLLKLGARTLTHTSCSAGVQSTHTHAHPLDVPVRPGEVIHIDVGGRFDGYVGDISRNGVVTKPSARQADIYARLHQSYLETLSAIRPGIPAGAVWRACADAMRRAQLTPPSGTIGHSIGVQMHEGFEIAEVTTRELEPGMVLTVEPTVIEAGDARYDIENMVLVTESGCDVISRAFDPETLLVVS